MGRFRIKWQAQDYGQATFYVNCLKKGKKAKIGYAKVNLAKFIHETLGAPLKLQLLKTPKSTKAFLRINIVGQLIKKDVEGDTDSVASGVSSLADFDDLDMEGT